MLVILLLAATAWLWVARAEDRRRAAWRELSLSARLREAAGRAEVFERSLARLRADAAAGKLTVDEAYRAVFDRLTAEARGPGDAPR